MIYTSSLVSPDNRTQPAVQETVVASHATETTPHWVQKSPEEEQLSKLGNKINDTGWIAFKPKPYSNRSLGKESITYLKEFLTKEFVINKIFDKEAKDKMLVIFNSKFMLASAVAEGKENKLKAFLDLPFWKEENVVMKGSIRLAQLLHTFLKSSKDVIKLKGGMARHLVLPWVQQSLKERLDNHLEITPQRKQVLNGNRPDWDFYKYTTSADQIRINNQILCIELAKEIFEETDSDFLLYYSIIVQKFICRSGEAHDGMEHNETIALQSVDGPKIDITQQQVGRNSHFFELHGLDVSITKSTLARWAANPKEKITKQDLEEVLVCTDRVQEDEGLQASFDLGFGLLHTKEIQKNQQKQSLPRYIYWVTNHCRSYEPELRQTYLGYLLLYVKKELGICVGKSILEFHLAHNQGDKTALKAMLFNTLISLLDEKNDITICQEFLNHTLSATDLEHNRDNIYTQCLINAKAIHQTLDIFKLFSFIKALCHKEDVVQAYFTKDNHLHVIDTFSSFIKFRPQDIELICAKIGKEYSINSYEALFNRMLQGAVLHEGQLEQLPQCGINWNVVSSLAAKLLSEPSGFQQKLGYMLTMLYANSGINSKPLYLSLIQNLPKVLTNSSADEKKALIKNVETILKNSPYSRCLEEVLNDQLVDIEDEALLTQTLMTAIAPIEADLVLAYWKKIEESLPSESRLELAKKLISGMQHISPNCALAIFASIQSSLNQVDELKLFLSILDHCNYDKNSNTRWQTQAHLQKILLIILKKPPLATPVIPEPRRAHGKKKQAPVPQIEQPSLAQKKSVISALVMASLDLCPDQDALELFDLAAKQQLIIGENISLDNIAGILNHAQGGKKSAISLSKICQEQQISLNPKANPTVALTLCKELLNETDTDCVELIEQFLPIIWDKTSSSAKNEESIELLRKKIDSHVSLDQIEQVANLLDLYGSLLVPTIEAHYKQYLFGKYLEVNDLTKAFEVLTHLHKQAAADSQIIAFLHLVYFKAKHDSDNLQEELLPFAEGLIDILFGQVEKFEAEEIKMTIVLIDKILESTQNKTFKEKIKAITPAIISRAQKLSITLELAPLIKTLVNRQMFPKLTSETVIALCQCFMRELIVEKEWIELINQLLAQYKLANSPEETHLQFNREVIHAMLRCQVHDQKWKQKTFDKIHQCLQLSINSPAAVITEEDLYHFVWVYKDHPAVEKLIETASLIPRLRSSQAYKASYAILTSNLNNLERSSRLLIEQKECCMSYGLDEVKKVVRLNIQAIIQTPTPVCLRNAVSCFFEYDMSSDLPILDYLLYAISQTMDDKLIEHVWKEFDKFLKTTFSSASKAIILNRIATLIVNHNHDCIRILFDRLPELCLLNMRAELNPEDWQNFKSFKTHLKGEYPDYYQEIARLDFKYYLSILSGATCRLEHSDRATIDLNKEYRDFISISGITTKLAGASSLHLIVLRAYAQKELLSLVKKEFKEEDRPHLVARAKLIADRVTAARFEPCYSMLDPQLLDLTDQHLIEMMYNCRLEENLISYVNQVVKTKEKNPPQLQLFLQDLLKRVEGDKDHFLLLISSVCAHFRRNPCLDAFSFLTTLMNLSKMEAHLEAFEILKLLFDINTSPTTAHSSLVTEIIKSVSMHDEIFKTIHDFLEKPVLKQWVTEEDLGLLWAVYYDRKFAIIRVNKSYDTDLFSDEIASLVHQCALIQKSKNGTLLVFASAVKTLLKHIDYRLEQFAVQQAVHHIGVLMLRFSSVSDLLIRIFTGSSETFVQEKDQFSPEKVRAATNNYAFQVGLSESDYDNDFVKYDEKIYTILVRVLNLCNEKSHHEMRNTLFVEYPFLKNNLTIAWAGNHNKPLFFELSKTLITTLLTHFVRPEMETMKYLAVHTAVIQMEYLILNYPDRVDDLVNLLDTCVFTTQVIAPTYVNRLNRYLIVKMMLTYPVHYSHTERLYKMLIFSFNRPLPFPDFDNKLNQHHEVITQLIKEYMPHKVQRALEMVSEIPAEIINSQNFEQYTLLMNFCLFSLTQQHFWEILFAGVKVPGVERRKLINDLIIDILCENEILSPKKNPYRSQKIINTAGSLCTYYLHNLVIIKKELGPGSLLFPAVYLFNCFKKLYDTGLWQHDDVLYDMLDSMKSIIIDELKGANMKVFPEMVKSLDFVGALLKLRFIEPSLKIKRARLIKDFLVEADDLSCDNQTAKEFLRQKFVETCEKLDLAKQHAKIYNILERKLFPHSHHQSLAKN